jgi:ABC-type branched-subunit amino acid transport system substrate-binding protein
VVAAVAALAWIPTACSSSAESGSASEAPLKLMLISTIQSPAFGFPEAVDGAKAAAKAINDAGGANGHRIEVEACNDQYNANTAAACAQKAVKEKFSGVITGYTSFGSQIMPFLEMKKVPFVGGQPSTAKEWNSPQAYPFSAGNNGYFAAIAQQMHKQGCTKMGLITNSNAQSADAGKAAAKAFEQAGGEIVYKVSIPPTTADTAPQVAALVKSGAQCVSDIIPPVTLLNFLTALQSAAPDMLAGCTGPDDATLAKISAAAKGCIRAEQSYPASDPHMADFTSALHEYKADAQVDVWSLNAYNGVLAFAQAAKTASDVTGPSLSKALDKMQFTPEGYPAPVDFSKSAGISGYDRLFNTTAVLMHFDGAKLVADGPVQLGDTLQHVLAGS